MKIRATALAPLVIPSLALLALAACQKPAATPALSLHEVMAGTIDPMGDAIWTVASKSYGQDGRAATGILADKDWAQIAEAAGKLHEGAAIIANNSEIAVVKPGMKILDEGVHPEAITAAQVTSYVEADRAGLTAHAGELANIADAIRKAALARDAPTTVKLSEDLDEVCESCHKQFWYPTLKAAPGAPASPAK